MSTVEDPKVSARASKRDFGARRFRWTAKDYEKLADVDVFWNRRVQLINGEIIEMSPQNSPHSDCVENLDETLRDAFGRAYRVRSQLPLDLGPSSQPEPDAVVLLRRPKGAHPKEAVLVVEVSATTLAFDRRIKSDLYAAARIPEYWICNIPDRQIEVHRRPELDPKRPGKFHYAEVTIVPADGFISPLAKPEARIAVADLLP
jgi:Uma2 family endonuclease